MKVIKIKKDFPGDPENYIKPHTETRYACVDENTNKILDDAQGFGYKTAQAAYKAWGWKHRSPEKKEKEKYTKEWIKKNKKICEDILDDIFHWQKDTNFEESVKLKDIEGLLESYKVDKEVIEKIDLRYLLNNL